MASMKRFVFWGDKKDKKHSSWRKLCDKWWKISFVYTLSEEEKEEWNPWSDWCAAFKEFQSSGEKPPKSERSRAVMFNELYKAAKLTGDKLEEANNLRSLLKHMTNENKELEVANCSWRANYGELQRKSEAQKVISALEVQKVEEERQQVEDKCREIMRRSEAEKKSLALQAQKAKKELQQIQDQCQELEGQLTSFQGQLLKCGRKFGFQVIITNGIICIPGINLKPTPIHPQLENVEAPLPLDHITDTATRLGQVTTSNLFDWLRDFEEEYKINHWSRQDLQQILFRCMDSGIFSSLVYEVREHLPTAGLDLCRNIAKRFIPDMDGILESEMMREDDTVMEYFHRMWMIYRLPDYRNYSSKNDYKYKEAICEGLLPHLHKEVRQYSTLDYEDIETIVLTAERSWEESENRKLEWFRKKRRAGAGCPPRWRIWNRLQNYPVPYEDIHNAPYWTLLVHLSKYEDLGAWMPRSTA